MDLTFERMTEADVDAVHAIERVSFTLPWSRQMFVNELKDRARVHYLTVRSGGGVVGYAGFWKIGDEAHLMNLAVAPEYRRCRIGERLLSALLGTARDLECRKATLEVREGNAAARRLYEKAGFDIIAVRKGYYPDNGEDALVLWICDLEKGPSSVPDRAEP